MTHKMRIGNGRGRRRRRREEENDYEESLQLPTTSSSSNISCSTQKIEEKIDNEQEEDTFETMLKNNENSRNNRQPCERNEIRKRCSSLRWLSLPAWLFIMAILVPPCYSIVETRCGSVDIRNTPNGLMAKSSGVDIGDADAVSFKNLTNRTQIINCTVIEGSFIVTMVSNTKNSSFTQDDFPRFMFLREITGSLMIFDVHFLKTLSWILPNLRVIGGQVLIQQYALVIFKNNDLEEIGLDNLAVIRNGGVRITDNKRLCHTKSINWKRLTVSPINDVVLDDAAELSLVETGRICKKGGCVSDPDQKLCRYHEVRDKLLQSCWGDTQCQRVCEFDRFENGTVGPGCDPNGEMCHPECIGGCDVKDDPAACHACLNQHYQGQCVSKCGKNLYSLINRRCLTKKQCESLRPTFKLDKLKIKAFNGTCSHRCPPTYEEDPSDSRTCRKCLNNKCRIVCPSTTIDSYQKAVNMKECHVIDGNLVIEFRSNVRSSSASSIQDHFSNLHTITGFLEIRRTPSLLNLFAFKNLKIIGGKQLKDGKYAVSIVENINMRKLFDPSINLTISNGSVQVHNNHLLCFKEITDFMNSTGRLTAMSDFDQSSSSNGDKAVCEEKSFQVRIDSINAESIMISWPVFETDNMDHRKFLGYEIFYKEVDRVNPNMTINDDRSACADSWHSVFSGSDNNDEATHRASYHVSEFIQPNRVYALYVATQVVAHVGARNAISGIVFARTLFMQPDPPIVTIVRTTSESIELSWEPPTRPNGIITYYHIVWRAIETDVAYSAEGFCSKRLYAASKRNDDDDDNIGEDGGDNDEDSSITTSTVSPNRGSTFSSIFGGGSGSGEGQCSSLQGCCECHQKPPDIEQTEEQSDFENKVHNHVFVQNQTRKRREISKSPESDKDSNDTTITSKEGVPIKDERDALRKEIDRTLGPDNSNKKNNRKTPMVIEDDEKQIASEAVMVNVTVDKTQRTQSFILNNLKHFTQYSITIKACQDETAYQSFCSEASKASKLKRTKPLPNVDRVLNETIQIDYMNTTSLVRITWATPNNTNGGILGYNVNMRNLALDASVQTECQPAVRNWSSEADGVIFKHPPDGEYSVEVIAYSLYSASEPSVALGKVVIRKPSIWTWKTILLAGTLFLIFILFVGFITYASIKRYYGKKVKLIADFMSSNPEYITEQVYTPDEWELERDDLQLLEVIGTGTFGQVFRGLGKNIVSTNGVEFGECAIKTVQSKATCEELLHFLMEANVMKGFDAPFIVKLLGVVSSGQPTLCVMEMMSLGNLRDYLRSRRPGAEENVDNLPVPSKEQYHEWASQIADGMAYLESIKFCHRDLAARNIMVRSDETVKIGDFGMARDLYYHDYYKPTGKRLMPVRWMAPESLKDGRFDSKSDCWSYGIVLYEMLTLGQQPYQGLGNDEVLNYISMSRKILDKPIECPDYWYKVMKMCWRYAPRDRPSFAQIVTLLLPHVSEEFKAISYVLNSDLQIEDADSDTETKGSGGGGSGSKAEDEGDYVREPGTALAAARLRTDSMALKEIRPLSSRSSSSHSSLFQSKDSRKSSMKSLMNHSRYPNNDNHHRHNSLDRISGSNSYQPLTNVPMGVANEHYQDGDYVEKDIPLQDMTKKPVTKSISGQIDPYSNGTSSNGTRAPNNKSDVSNEDGYCMSNRNGIVTFGNNRGEDTDLLTGEQREQ